MKLHLFSQSINSQREYEKAVLGFSIKNQLRYKGNLGKYYTSINPTFVIQRKHIFISEYKFKKKSYL